MCTVSRTEKLKETPNKAQVSGLFRICFAVLIAGIFYFILFLYQMENNDSWADLQRIIKKNVLKNNFFPHVLPLSCETYLNLSIPYIYMNIPFYSVEVNRTS